MMKRLLAALAALLLAAMPVKAAAASISINEPGPYHFLDTVSFTVEVPKLKGYEYPMALVRCYQGTTEVWASLQSPDKAVQLGNAISNSWISGDAECTVELWAYRGLHSGGPTFLAAAPEIHVIRP